MLEPTSHFQLTVRRSNSKVSSSNLPGTPRGPESGQGHVQVLLGRIRTEPPTGLPHVRVSLKAAGVASPEGNCRRFVDPLCPRCQTSPWQSQREGNQDEARALSVRPGARTRPLTGPLALAPGS